MASSTISPQQSFAWQPQPEPAALVAEILAECCRRNPELLRWEETLRRQSGTRLIDWTDHFALPWAGGFAPRLEKAGFVATGHDRQDHGRPVVWQHPGGLFPPIILQPDSAWRWAMQVESVSDFLAARGATDSTAVGGLPGGPLRKARWAAAADVEWWVVERHGYPGWELPKVPSRQIAAARRHQCAFQSRLREFSHEEEGFAQALELIRAAVNDLGCGWASDLFFAAERRYWTARNRAGQVQKARQDALGLGWANHDHHTYRSSRAHFQRLIALLEELGLVCRERFYAGQEAGWGAQVLEQPESRVVVFADVDLAPEEVLGDFAHEGLSPAEHFGTVGIWCLLHGEAFLQPGMHHLECRFDFAAARSQLQQAGITVMPPFTDLPFLKQAFTAGEIWPVEPRRLQTALAAGAISPEQAERFAREGVLGSHLELLQRDAGYKGFNPAGINEIIRATDPRRDPRLESA